MPWVHTEDLLLCIRCSAAMPVWVCDTALERQVPSSGGGGGDTRLCLSLELAGLVQLVKYCPWWPVEVWCEP